MSAPFENKNIQNIPPLPKRRVLISESGAVDLPLQLGGRSSLPDIPATKPPQEIEDRKGETARVAKRLLALIEDHRVAATRLGVALDAPAIDVVLRALEAETRREDPTPILKQGEEVQCYVLTALYEELIAEPSNILFTTQVSEDIIRYEAMEAAFWAECIAALRKKLTPVKGR
jgi:hypothetical protein